MQFSLLLFLSLLFCLSLITLACNQDEYYGSKLCVQVYGVVSDFECKKCPANAVQYTEADESCVCKPGYYATGAYFMCADYLGNGGVTSRVWPAVEDGITCTKCSEFDLCPGGAYEVVSDSVTYWSGNYMYLDDDFYVQCVSCSKSGYMRLPKENGINLKGVKWKLQHAPRRRCPIYGQSFVDGNRCECPDNSDVAYSLARKEGVPDASLSSAGGGIFLGYKDVWNYNVKPLFDPPWPSDYLPGQPKYFGRCECKPGYYRANSVRTQLNFFSEACQPCPQGSYCIDGAIAGCAAGWTTASTASTSPRDCSVCLSGCNSVQGGQFCDARKANQANEACSDCPIKYYCPASVAMLYQPTICPKGYNCSRSKMVQPMPCEDGSFNDKLGSTACEKCGVGNFSKKVSLDSPGIEACQSCGLGRYQDAEGQSECKPCTADKGYQDETGKSSCKSCPAGYQKMAVPPTNTNGFEKMSDLCEQCRAGWANDKPGGACAICPKGTYAEKLSGSTACVECSGGKTTAGEGSTSAGACFCPAEQYESSTGVCRPCGTCLVNEYVASPCGGTSNVQCRVCDAPCPTRQDYVPGVNLCKGTHETSSQQTCSPCRLATQCSANSPDYVTLLRCYSGEISVDTTVCVPSASHANNALEFRCSAGTYLEPLSLSSSTTNSNNKTTFSSGGSKVLLNAPNSMVAEILFEFGSPFVLRIYRSESQFNPLVIASEGVAQQLPAVPLLSVVFDRIERTQNSPVSREYVYKVLISHASSVTASSFVHHPMSSALRQKPTDLSPGDKVIASGTWSYDGSAFFLLWTDCTLSKALFPSSAAPQFIPVWSSSSSSSLPQPLWPAIHLAAAGYAHFVRHQCIAVPMHPPDLIAPSRQIQLICLITFVRDLQSLSFGSYLVRVMGDGSRMRVDMELHTTPHASSSLFYDISFNSVYVSTYARASFTGPRHVLKVRLNAGYNFKSEITSTPENFSPPVQLESAFKPSGWIMPRPFVEGQNYPTYPEGMSLDYAAVEPASNVLLFYVPTLTAADSYLHLLYYIPVGSSSTSGERSMQPVLIRSKESSTYADGLLSRVMGTVYTTPYAPEMIFTLHAGLFVRYGWISAVFQQLGTCQPCPAGLTSLAEDNDAVDDCFCQTGTYYNAFEGRCVPVTPSCRNGEYILRRALPDSDIACDKCPSCPPGFYRDPDDCKGDEYRPYGQPPKCLPCTQCDPGWYMDPVRCSPDGTSPGSKSDCRPCSTCDTMQLIVGKVCTGNTTVNTQMCIDCSSTCPKGMFITPSTQRCNGKTYLVNVDDYMRPFDPATECTPCADCPFSSEARVSGCEGNRRQDDGFCQACGQCAVGEYITGQCTRNPVDGSFSNTCTACPVCEAGKYLSRPCSGKQLGAPDHVCQPCATCPLDKYMAPCGYQQSRAVYTKHEWLPPPPDANVCLPCRTCPSGSYISKRCDGTKLVDDRECSACVQTCPAGQYMHANCSGLTYNADSNDCRRCTPCLPGEYMRSGRCTMDPSTATSPLDRVCRACSMCYPGEYRTALCTGTDFYQSIGCEACDLCPEGSYLRDPCDGTSLFKGTPGRNCTACKTCPQGFYRVGCSNGPGSGTSSALYDDSTCAACAPCPDGYYISRPCTGSGSSPTDRECTKCGACAREGQYYASGCTGKENTGNFTCADCARPCGVGQYIAQGCNGSTSFPDAELCLPCQQCRSSPIEFISTQCTGRSTSSLNRTCTRCSCPDGFTPCVSCNRNRTYNHVCTNSDQCPSSSPPPPTPAAPTPVPPPPAPTPAPTLPPSSTSMLAKSTTTPPHRTSTTTATSTTSSTTAQATTTTTASNVPGTTPEPPAGPSVGVIVGASVGGVAALVIIGALIASAL